MTRRRRAKSPLFAEEDPQLGLFERADEEATKRTDDTRGELESLRGRLPAKLRLGTSSWTFPGWAGLVYRQRYANQRAFLRDSLGEYARHPLMRTVGVDRGYYTPVAEEELAAYSKQLPDDFRAAMKVWQRVTMPGFPRHARYGAEAGEPELSRPGALRRSRPRTDSRRIQSAHGPVDRRDCAGSIAARSELVLRTA